MKTNSTTIENLSNNHWKTKAEKLKWLFLLFLSAMFSANATAQTISRSPWQKLDDGLTFSEANTVISFAQHGDVNMYQYASIPGVTDSRWVTATLNSSGGVEFSQNSLLPTCLNRADFTYFQTNVSIPSNFTISTATVSFASADDGVRVYVFNSAYPSGGFVLGTEIKLGQGNVTGNISSLLRVGEVNRIVLVQADDCPSGNNMSNAQMVVNGTVVNSLPTITCGSNVTVSSAANQCGALVNFTAATATGSPTPTITYSQPSGSFFPVGTTAVTATATNTAGSTSCTFNVIVTDNTPPIVKTKNNIFINLGPTGVTTVTVPQIDSISTDACGIASRSVSPSSFSCADVGKKTVTLTVTDNNGNVATGIANVEVIDNIAPNVVIQPVTVYLNANGTASVTAAQVNNGSSDACGIASMTLDKTSFTCANASTSNSGVLTVRTSVDNEYSAYISTDDNVQGTFVGSGNNWPTLTTYTTNLVAGQTYYLHVFAQDWGGTEMMIGDFEVTGDFKFINGAQTMSTTAANWKVSGSGWSNYVQAVDVGPNGTLPWGNYPGVSSAARFIWRSPLNPSASDVAYFTTPIYYTGNNAVLFTATDASGNSASALANITVLDAIAPTMTCPANISTTATSASGRVVSYATPTATDNCSSATVTRIAGPASGSVFPIGTTTVTYKAVDPSGNSTNCSFTITVSGLAPVIVSPGNKNVNNAPGQCNAPVSFAASETTGIPASVITYSHAPGSVFPIGTTTVTATATNAVGSSSTSFDVTILDTELPSVHTQNLTIGLDASGNASITASQINDGSIDNCSISTYNISQTAFNCSHIGNNTIILTVVDIHGNQSTANAMVTVLDQLAPNVITQNLTVQLDVNGTASITAAQVDNGSNDNCSIASISVAPSTFTCANIGSNTVILTVTDGSGNVSTANATVTVEDNITPTAIAQNVDLYLDATGNASTSVAQVNNGSYDNCAIQSIDLSRENFDCSTVGANTVMLTVTDVNGNTSTASAVVNVHDNIAPNAITQNVTVQLNASGNASVTAAQVNNGSNDNCSIASIAVAPNTFTCANVGANAVVLTVTDVNGNVSTANATVTVQDNIAPNAIAQNITIQLDASGNASITAAQVNNGSNDNCSVDSLVVTPNAFTCANVGSNTVVLSVTDVNGNVSTANATITVEDNIAPNAIAQNVTIQLDATGNASVTATQVNNGSNDNCSVASLAVAPNTFTCANLGGNAVVLTVTDVNGNVSTTNATITVEDNIAPNAIAKDISVTLVFGQAIIAAEDIDNGSNDNCSVDVLSVTPNTFNCSNIGLNTVVLTVIDGSGNTTTDTAIVTVIGAIPTASITQGIQPAFTQGGAIVLTASSPTAINYSWLGGPANATYNVYASGVYTVTVTNEYGCTADQTSTVTYSSQDLLSSYTIIGEEEVELDDHVVVYNGGVGATDRHGEVEIEDYSNVTAAGTFVRAWDIDTKRNSSATTKFLSAVPTSILPAFLTNPYCNGNNNSCGNSHHNSCSHDHGGHYGCGSSSSCSHSHHRSCSNNSNGSNNNKNISQNATVAISDSIMGTVVIGKNSTVTFTAPDIYIKDLEIKEGATVLFTQCAVIRICNHAKIDKNVSFNATNSVQVTMYIEKKFDVDEGADVTVNVYALDKISIKAKSNSPSMMKGLFIGEKVKAEKYVSFYWNTANSCAPTFNKTAIVENENGLVDTYFEADVYPNPAVSSFNIRLFSSSSAPFTIEVYDLNGRLMETQTSENTSLYHEMGQAYADGMYFVKITQDSQTKTLRLIKTNR
jgi:hypothetical protein